MATIKTSKSKPSMKKAPKAHHAMLLRRKNHAAGLHSHS